jgi:hypothetical protein
LAQARAADAALKSNFKNQGMKMKTSNTLSKKLFGGVFAIALTGLFSSLANAQLDFDFSATVGYQLVADTSASVDWAPITGEIIGLGNSGSSTPLDVIIFSAPAQYTSELASNPQYPININYPYDFGLQAGSSITGSLTVTNNNGTETITAGTLSAVTSNGLDLSLSSIIGEGNGGNFLYYDRGGDGRLYNNDVGNFDGLPGVTYSEVVATPEPSTWALVVSGLALLAFWRRRARRALL